MKVTRGRERMGDTLSGKWWQELNCVLSAQHDKRWKSNACETITTLQQLTEDGPIVATKILG